MYTLPNGETVNDINVYAAAWKELSDDLTQMFKSQNLNVLCIGIDPDIHFAQLMTNSDGELNYDHYGPISRISADMALTLQNIYKQSKVV